MKRREQFYVGYQARAAKGTAAFIGPRIAALLAVALVLAVVLVVAQRPFDIAYFDYGNARAFSGIVSETPYPTLLVERPGDSRTLPFSRYWLVATGKHGATTTFAGLHGRRVDLRGTLIYRDGQTMIEIVPGSVAAGAITQAIPAPQTIGQYTLTGEIIDSKCYLGVMKPGYGKVHRACAIRCISGGIPPLFVARDTHDNPTYLLLTGADGRALNKEILDMIAEPLQISGEVARVGSDLILRAEPAKFQRLARSRSEHVASN